MGELSENFFDLIRKHYEFGTPIDRMRFTAEQKKRMKICEEVYMRFATDPFMDITAYLKNKYGRTMCEIRSDKKVIDFIAAFHGEGQKHISKMRVRHAAEKAMRDGANMGDMKVMLDGAKLLKEVDDVTSKEEAGDNTRLVNMPIVITSDVSKKFSGKKRYTDEEMQRIRAKYGVKMDPWQEMVQGKDGEYVEAHGDGPDEREESLEMTNEE